MDAAQTSMLEALEKHKAGLVKAMDHLKENIDGYGHGEVEYLIQTNMLSQTYFKEMWSLLAAEKLKRMKLEDEEEAPSEVEKPETEE